MHKYSFIIIHLKTMGCLVSKFKTKNKPSFVEYIWTLIKWTKQKTMDVKKININQSELTYNIASDIYDITANNNGATFESLSALLSDENLSTLIPSAIRCGGMTIRFI